MIQKSINCEMEKLFESVYKEDKNLKMHTLLSPLKILLHKEKLEEIYSNKIKSPITVEIDPSNKCNHNCIFCIYHFMHPGGEMLNKETLFRLIDELGSYGVKSIIFNGGGEPLTNPFTIDAIQRVNKNKLKSALVTNGGLITENMYEKLINYCDYVRISLDASNENTHYKIHRSGDFNIIKKNIVNLGKLRKENNKINFILGISFLINSLNYKEIYSTAKFAKYSGCNYIQFKTTPNYQDENSLTYLDSEHIHESKGLINLSKNLQNNSFGVVLQNGIFSKKIPQEKRYFWCGLQRIRTIINASGKVFACGEKRGNDEYCLGNIKEKSFKNIWESKLKIKMEFGNFNKKCTFCGHNEQNMILNYLRDNMKNLHIDFV